MVEALKAIQDLDTPLEERNKAIKLLRANFASLSDPQKAILKKFGGKIHTQEAVINDTDLAKFASDNRISPKKSLPENPEEITDGSIPVASSGYLHPEQRIDKSQDDEFTIEDTTGEE